MEFVKGLLVVIIILGIGVTIYSVINAIQTYKRNKATDAMTQQIFLAQTLQNNNIKQEHNEATAPVQPIVTERPLVSSMDPATIKQHEPKKELNYDEVEEVIIEDTGKGLKDFYNT